MSDATTGTKKNTVMSSKAGARKNHAAVFASAGIRTAFVFIVRLAFFATSCNAASRAAHSHPDRARRESDRWSSFRGQPAHRARTLWSRSLPTREPAVWEQRDRADRGTHARERCWRAKCPASYFFGSVNH